MREGEKERSNQPLIPYFNSILAMNEYLTFLPLLAFPFVYLADCFTFSLSYFLPLCSSTLCSMT
jgi:hypothetical protein